MKDPYEHSSSAQILKNEVKGKRSDQQRGPRKQEAAREHNMQYVLCVCHVDTIPYSVLGTELGGSNYLLRSSWAAASLSGLEILADLRIHRPESTSLPLCGFDARKTNT
jgi:hypothetical protein